MNSQKMRIPPHIKSRENVPFHGGRVDILYTLGLKGRFDTFVLMQTKII